MRRIPINIVERITDKNNKPVKANITLYEEESISYTTFTDIEGKYNLSIVPAIYDILYSISEFFIKDFWLKLLSVNISSTSYNKLTHLTSYEEQKNISMIFNITGNQTIQAFSPEKPKRVLKNSTALKEFNSTSDLIASYGWFYNETEKIIYVKFNETVE